MSELRSYAWLAGPMIVWFALGACGSARDDSAAPSSITSNESISDGNGGQPTSDGNGGQPTSDRNGGHRPGGAPPGVKHELPKIGDRIGQRSQWIDAFRGVCNFVGEPRDCLKIKYVFFGPGRERIVDPGDDPEQAGYGDCIVRKIVPPTGEGVKIPSGSTIAITIECTTLSEDGDDPPKSTSATENNTSATKHASQSQ